MIIKKKKLDKITGNMSPAEEQYEESLQENSSAYYSDDSVAEYPQQYQEEENISAPEYEEDLSEDNFIPDNNYQDSYAENQVNEESINPNNTDIQPVTPEPQIQQPVQTSNEEEINLFDLDNIDFSQRQERRRGDRRRGFRRVDDRNLVSRAREEADAIRESAQKEGYQAGLNQAQADIEEVRNSLAQFVCTKQEVFDAIAPKLLEISVEIAQKIIKKEIEQGPEVLFNTIVDVLKTSLSKEETKVTLRVNPAEVNEVKQAVPELLNLSGIDTKIVVLADEEVSEGGCQITTTNGIVDATLESRMRVVMQALREI